MGKRARALVAAAVGLAVLPVGGASAQAGHDHEFTTLTWTAAESPYVLEEDHVVDIDETLVIEPGVEVRAARGVHLIVYGELDVNGTAADPVTFTVARSGDERWGGIWLRYGDHFHHSDIEGAVFDRAVTALHMDGAAADVADSTFHTNLVGVRLSNPESDVVVERSIFENHRTAVTGFTRRSATFAMNDFSNNFTTLLPRPEPKYDCGPDAGVWDIHQNDILRGPTNSDYYSNDVRTPPGSAVSAYVVSMTQNWWGTADEERIEGRMTVQINCCPQPSEKEIDWRPVAVLPQTPYEPVWDDPDPDPEPPGHGDPGVVTAIDTPVHGSCLESRSFDRIKGGFGGGLGGPLEVKVALRRKSLRGCRWWSHKRQRLVPGECSKQRWFRAEITGSDSDRGWRYVFDKQIPSGKYMAWSYGTAEPVHLGRNQVAFYLR